MTHYPAPVLPPAQVALERKERERQLISACLRGIAIRLSIILVEIAGVIIFGSASLFLDALASLFDVASTVLLVIFIKLAARPPDQNHPFGHGRYEPLMGLQLGLLILVTGGGLLIHQLVALSTPIEGKEINGYVWIIPFCAVILLESCYHFFLRVAKRQNSPALAADAIHYRIDGLTSLCAAIALIVAAYIPTWGVTIDHLGAVCIALVMIILGIYAALQNLHQVIDRAPSTEYFDRVRKAAKMVNGVRETEKIRIQLYGPDAHVDIDIEVDPKLSVEVAHAISQKVRVEIQKEWPQVQDVTVHIEPFYPNDH